MAKPEKLSEILIRLSRCEAEIVTLRAEVAALSASQIPPQDFGKTIREEATSTSIRKRMSDWKHKGDKVLFNIHFSSHLIEKVREWVHSKTTPSGIQCTICNTKMTTWHEVQFDHIFPKSGCTEAMNEALKSLKSEDFGKLNVPVDTYVKQHLRFESSMWRPVASVQPGSACARIFEIASQKIDFIAYIYDIYGHPSDPGKNLQMVCGLCNQKKGTKTPQVESGKRYLRNT